MKLDDKVRQLLNDEYFVKWIIDPDYECEAFWKAWIKQDPARENYVSQAKEFVIRNLAREKDELSSSRHQAMWQAIHSKIQPTEVRKTLFWSGKRLRYVAVTVILVSAITILHYVVDLNGGSASIEEIAYRETMAPKGKKISLHLEDGTWVYLNAGSRIHYPEEFSRYKREVFLEGEAFFQVERDPQRPFIVYSKNIQTTVLGTSFNINAYQENDHIDVAVVTGKVTVLDTLMKSDTIQLVPAQRATYFKKNRQLIHSDFDINEVALWKEGIINFKDAGFDEIQRTLEYWYGVEIIVKAKPKIENDFNGSFDNKSLETVLRGLSFSLDFSYTVDNKTIYIDANQ